MTEPPVKVDLPGGGYIYVGADHVAKFITDSREGAKMAIETWNRLFLSGEIDVDDYIASMESVHLWPEPEPWETLDK